MATAIIEWHLYPETDCDDLKWYLITRADCEDNKVVEAAYKIGSRFYDAKEVPLTGIMAWAEMPKPFMGEKEMHILIGYKGKMFRVEQNKRGMGTEADVVITLKANELYRRSFPKCRDIESLRQLGIQILTEMDKNDHK